MPKNRFFQYVLRFIHNWKLLLASNRFGNLFCVTTWGESHGKAIGAVIDGCPAGLPLSKEDIQKELNRRRPGHHSATSSRKEEDLCDIYSGVFEGLTTGAPISIIIFNQDAQKEQYANLKNAYRPGHANFTYLEKYGIFDPFGSGRASGRETALRVAAGAIAKKILALQNIEVTAYLSAVGDITAPPALFQEHLKKSPLFCPCPLMEAKVVAKISQLKESGDSLGGLVALVMQNVPAGLGDPIYEKLEANLAKAMLSIPACKGVEFGAGFRAASMLGSEHNDSYILEDGVVKTSTNHAGGILGGISNGNTIELSVAFKPASSIKIPIDSLSFDKMPVKVAVPEEGRHDPVIAIRAAPVVEAMGALVLVDALLMNRTAKLFQT